MNSPLKALAALQGKTIRQYAMERPFPGDADGDAAWLELKAFLAARVEAGLAGKGSDKSVAQILGEELTRERGTWVATR